MKTRAFGNDVGVFRRARQLFRLSLAALAGLAWRNRDEVAEWAGFGVRAARAFAPGGSGADDIKIESRLRYSLARDRRTRRADGLTVSVRDGIARLRGVVDPEVAEVAPYLAEHLPGVRGVDNQLRVAQSRRWFGRSRPAVAADEVSRAR
jgi:hypothetical protein